MVMSDNPLGIDLSKVTDEQLRVIGATREELEAALASIESPEQLLAETNEGLAETESNLNQTIGAALAVMDEHPENRTEGMAIFYGELVNAVAGSDEEVEINQLLMVVAVAVWRLAEEYVRDTLQRDGNHRADPSQN